MPAFTPEQEARIAEIVRAVLSDQPSESAKESSGWTWDQLGQAPGIVDLSPLTVTLAGGRIVLDAPEIVATSAIQLEPPKSA